MAGIVKRLVVWFFVAVAPAGCVALPEIEFDVSRRDDAHRTPASTETDTARQSSTLSGSVPLQLEFRDVATMLDVLMQLERVDPALKSELLAELSRADAKSATAIIAKWQGRVHALEASAPAKPVESPALHAAASKPRNSSETAGSLDSSDSNPSPGVSVPSDPIRFHSALGQLLRESKRVQEPNRIERNELDEPAQAVPESEPDEPPTWDELLHAVSGLARERSEGMAPEAELARVQTALLELVRQSEAGELASRPDAELWRQLAPAVEFALGAGGTERTPQDIIDSLRVATELVRGPGQFQVRGLAFCKRIRGFGNTELIDSPVFRPGQPVLLYSEVENFLSEPAQPGFRTKLASRLEIVEPGGNVVWKQEFAALDDWSEAPRRDFFMSHTFRLPSDLKPGRLTLRLTLLDETADQTAFATVAMLISKD